MENRYKFSRLYSSDREWISIGEEIHENSIELKQQGVITGWMSSVFAECPGLDFIIILIQSNPSTNSRSANDLSITPALVVTV